MPDTNHVTLTAKEVDIIKKLRAADLVDAIGWYDDHAWKMLIAVGRQLAKRPTYEKQQHRETPNARR